MKPDGTARRLVVVALALSVSAAILRPFVAEAVVARGDQVAAERGIAAASAYYERALRLDPYSVSAVDRMVFAALQERTRSALQRGIVMARGALRRSPGATMLRLDRALALRALGRHREAYEEFSIVARTRRDFRLYGLAAHAANGAGDATGARWAWRKALDLEPRYRVAAKALKERGR